VMPMHKPIMERLSPMERAQLELGLGDAKHVLRTLYLRLEILNQLIDPDSASLLAVERRIDTTLDNLAAKFSDAGPEGHEPPFHLSSEDAREYARMIGDAENQRALETLSEIGNEGMKAMMGKPLPAPWIYHANPSRGISFYE